MPVAHQPRRAEYVGVGFGRPGETLELAGDLRVEEPLGEGLHVGIADPARGKVHLAQTGDRDRQAPVGVIDAPDDLLQRGERVFGQFHRRARVRVEETGDLIDGDINGAEVVVRLAIRHAPARLDGRIEGGPEGPTSGIPPRPAAAPRTNLP